MEEYLFTFCNERAGYCQPIFAENYMKAREKMFELNGDYWAFQYSREEWELLRNRPGRNWDMEQELTPIYAVRIPE